MTIRDPFNDAAAPDATWEREGKPDPARLAERGILTRESIAWMAAKKPDSPAPEYNIDDADIRGAADEAVREEHRARINEIRQRFRDRSLKGREDFNMATPDRDQEWER